jgi:hypothetical protein
MTIAASGTPTYGVYSDVVESLIRTEGRSFLFPGLDKDDIAQEIRMECVRVMTKFDADRIGPSPYRYLKQCVRNFLFNMRRGIYVPNNPPCVRCPYWSKHNKTCLIDEAGCQKIVDYRQNMARRAAIHNPGTLDSEVLDYSVGASVDAIVLDESIRDILPESLLIDYNLMKNGRSSEVSLKNKRAIRQLVQELLDAQGN